MEQQEYRGLTITYHQEEYPPNPRKEFDNLTTMLCNHPRYDLGDKQADNVYEMDDAAIFAPLYLHDHSGITISHGPIRKVDHNGHHAILGYGTLETILHNAIIQSPGMAWDTSMVGYVYINRADLLKEFERKRLSNKLLLKAADILMDEVKEYNMYLTGDVWGYTVEDEDGFVLDSCGGYYELERAKADAMRAANYIVEKEVENTLEDLEHRMKDVLRQVDELLQIRERVSAYT